MKDIDKTQVSIGKPVTLETKFGLLRVHHLFSERQEGILITGEKPFANPIPIRIQSSCVFNESLLSLDCDCASQLHAALRIIVLEGGLVVYLYEEGRGAGLRDKIEAMRVQQRLGCDTVTAFSHLGLQPDIRDYKVAIGAISAMIGCDSDIELLTNNPTKVKVLQKSGLTIVARRPLVIHHNDERVIQYLAEKARVLGHIIDEEATDKEHKN
jgi:GTP cyclohydrolase II